MLSFPQATEPRRRVLLRAALGMGALLVTGVAHATDTVASLPRPAAYGVFVGTNEGGPGQARLRFAEDDAQRMAAVVGELGRYGSPDIRLLRKPNVASVLATIDAMADKLHAHAQRGEQTVFVFYYSGHAKANASNLGTEELPVHVLRDKLRNLPTTLTLVVLDACQSGQFARTKGAEPAADFSFNSVARLRTKGIAVLASSSAHELSQESDALQGSFFTHHLVTGLRGAADADADGRISLDEAYKYAYRQTLLSTAATKVGGQHVVLETDMAGQGDVPVTYPAEARSQLELPGPLQAGVIVVHKGSGNVVAEVQKVPGAPLRLALPSGTYEAIVRGGLPQNQQGALRCGVSLADQRTTVLGTDSCALLKDPASPSAKGILTPDDGVADGSDGSVVLPTPVRDGASSSAQASSFPSETTPWAFEAGVGLLASSYGAYAARLRDFQFSADEGRTLRLEAAFSGDIVPGFALGARIATMGNGEWTRSMEGFKGDSFAWKSWGTMVIARAHRTLVGSSKKGRLDAFGQAGLGFARATSTLTLAGSDAERHTETQTGVLFGGALGLELVPPQWLFGFYVQGGYDHAPAMTNLYGDTQNVGGWALIPLGSRLHF